MGFRALFLVKTKGEGREWLNHSTGNGQYDQLTFETAKVIKLPICSLTRKGKCSNFPLSFPSHYVRIPTCQQNTTSIPGWGQRLVEEEINCKQSRVVSLSKKTCEKQETIYKPSPLLGSWWCRVYGWQNLWQQRFSSDVFLKDEWRGSKTSLFISALQWGAVTSMNNSVFSIHCVITINSISNGWQLQ